MPKKFVTNVKIDILNGRELYVKWKWNREKNTIASFNIKWRYFYKGTWFDESTHTLQIDEEYSTDKDDFYTDTYSAPDEAKKVKVKIQPISKTKPKKKNGKDELYWGPFGYSQWFPNEDGYQLTVKKAQRVGAVSNLNIYMEQGTTTNLRASWDWNEDHTASYSVRWDYTPGDGNWYLGAESSETIKTSVWSSIPANAMQVRVYVTPIAKTRNILDQEVAYWIATRSDPVKFSLKAPPPPVVGKVTDINIIFESESERRLYVDWKWKEDHTESYTIKRSWLMNNNTTWIIEDPVTVNTQQYRWTAESNSIKERITILPNAEMRPASADTNWKEIYWWMATESEEVTYSLEPGAVSDVGSVSDLKILIEYGTERNMRATWTWTQDNTDSFSVLWSYETGDGIWWDQDGGETSVQGGYRNASYNPPENATKVKVKVKPIAETRSDKGTELPCWYATWAESAPFAFVASEIKTLSAVSDVQLSVEPGTDRNMIATWTWNEEHTASYTVLWAYDPGNGMWIEKSGETSVGKPPATYGAESNAVSVKFRVLPVAETHLENGLTVAYWTTDWSDEVIYTFVDKAQVPSAPTVTINKFTLTAEVNVNDENASEIEFQVVRNNSEIFSTGRSKVTMGYASYSCSVNAGDKYKVRCRAFTDEGEASDWSDYSESKGTIPATPSGITSCKALSSKSVELTWNAVENADTYEIQYTTNKLYFDASSDVQSMSVESTTQHAIVTGLETGEEWFFRLRATNSNGSSGWCSPVSVVLGKAPDAPTTWSQTTTAIVGEDVILYWVHNSEDGSKQTAAEIELTIGGVVSTKTITTNYGEDDEEETNSYVLDTSSYTEGTVIQWRVRTKGILPEYSPWSTLRTIDVYAPPTLVLNLSMEKKWFWDTFNFETDSIYTAYGGAGAWNDVLTAFPYFITATPGPATQKAIGYYLTIISNETYETVNHVGEEAWVNKGDEVYAKYFDATYDALNVVLMPSDIDLANGVRYTVHCLVYMDSGLTAEASADFTVDWIEEDIVPDGTIILDKEAVITYVHPYCEDDDGNFIKDILLSVYRREFDGTFTEIAKDIENTGTNYVTDPHPALDYARYRIVSMSRKTGAIEYYDMPAYPVGEIAAIIQWNEKWSNFDSPEEDEFAEHPWAGSMLRLPYNLDVSDSHDVDKTLVNYIGRSYPVSYYGTQLGSTSTWNMEIAKDDEETLYQLRRMARYTGDMYVREPSGSGYWANVSVSFSQTHCEVTIPVTLNITRVDGGM